MPQSAERGADQATEQVWVRRGAAGRAVTVADRARWIVTPAAGTGAEGGGEIIVAGPELLQFGIHNIDLPAQATERYLLSLGALLYLTDQLRVRTGWLVISLLQLVPREVRRAALRQVLRDHRGSRVRGPQLCQQILS